MSLPVTVHLLPELFSPESLQGCAAVVIDILRASTTICHALEAGAERIIPCLSVEEARQLESNDPSVLLGGERAGKIIEGFDLDNSPLAYTPERVAGKTIAFTTTNGTKALHRCKEAASVLVGAFSNLSAIVNRLHSDHLPVHLVCAGTNGEITGEDVLFAGAVVFALNNGGSAANLENDSAGIALDYWKSNSGDEQALRQAMFDSRGGRNLQELGLSHDIERACRRNLLDLVPEWVASENGIS